MKFFNLMMPAVTGPEPNHYPSDFKRVSIEPDQKAEATKKTRAQEFKSTIDDYDKSLGKLKNAFLKDYFFTYGDLKEQERFSGDSKEYKAFEENRSQAKEEKSKALSMVISSYVNCPDHLREDLNKQKEIPELLTKIFTNKKEDPDIRLKALHAIAKSEDLDTLLNLLASDAIDKHFGVEQIEQHVFDMPAKQQKLVISKLTEFCSSGNVSNSLDSNKNSTRAHRVINLLMELERKGFISSNELNDACISVLKGKNVNASLVNTALAQMKLTNLTDVQKAELRTNSNVQENLKSRPEKGHYPDWPYENLKRSLETTVSSTKIDLSNLEKFTAKPQNVKNDKKMDVVELPGLVNGKKVFVLKEAITGPQKTKIQNSESNDKK